MLEIIAVFTVTLASKFVIIAGAIESLAGSFASIVVSLGAISLSISGALAWLSTILPVPNKDGFYKIIHKYINVFGGNIGNAVNKLTNITEEK